uniref:Cyclin N-terminal domain-containing protein n=1 Tax=Dunaliella tertiolecta TaxID=3047 RepID=A0A7S3VLC1_DUNTE
MLVAACLLLASKVEEAAVSNNHLLNLVSMLHELLIVHHIPPSRILGAQQTCLEAATSHACHTEGAAAGTGAAGADPRHKSSAPAAAPAAPPPPHTQQGMNTGAVENGATQQQQQQYRYVQQQQQCPQQQRHVDAPTHDLQLALSRCQVLVGDAYYAAKSQLLLAEQVVLRLLRFRLPTPHPTAALLHIAAMLRVPAILASASLCLLHDAATFSTVLLPLPPSGRSTNALGLSNTTKRSRVGPHAWTSNCQPDRQDGQQGVRRRGAGGSEDSKEEGWGVVAEEDELEGRALLAALMANSQCMPSVGQVVANSRRLPSIGQADGQGPHALPHTGAQQTQTQDPSAAGQGVGARIQQTRSPAVGSHRSLLQEGAPLIPASLVSVEGASLMPSCAYAIAGACCGRVSLSFLRAEAVTICTWSSMRCWWERLACTWLCAC